MQAKYPNPFIVFCQKTIPLAFDESMSYMEALYAFKAYLENEIVPTVNTNGQAVQDLTNLVNQMQDYIDHYFDNLDVQEEVNKKLDEMAEDGTLEQILSQYVQPAIDNLTNDLQAEVTARTNADNSLQSQIGGLTPVVNNLTSDLSTEITNRTSADSSLQSQINGLASGSPLVASSTAGMTDTTKIYVNTTDGHWYYWNGSAWTDGGVYQASGLSVGSTFYDSLTKTTKNESYKVLQAEDLPWIDSINWATGVMQTNSTDVTSCAVFRVSKGTVIEVSDIFKCRITYWDEDGGYVGNTGTYAVHESTTIGQDGWAVVSIQPNPSTSTFVNHSNITNTNIKIKGLKDNRFNFIEYPLTFTMISGTSTQAESTKIYVGKGTVVKGYGFNMVSQGGGTQDAVAALYVNCYDKTGNVIIAHSADFDMRNNYTVGQDCYISIKTRLKSAKTITSETLGRLQNLYEIDYVAPTTPELLNKRYYQAYIGQNNDVEIIEEGNSFGYEGNILVRWNGDLIIQKGNTVLYSISIEEAQELFPANAFEYNSKQWLKIPGNTAFFLDKNDDTLKIALWKSNNNLTDNVYQLLVNAYQNIAGGYLYTIKLKKEVITTPIFNSAPYLQATDWKAKSKAFSKLLNTTGKNIETFTFFTDQHLMGDDESDYTESLPLRIGTIQKVYNSTPMNFIVSGGDWLNNDDTVDQACFKLGFVDGFMKSMFKNSYLIVGNHDTNYQGEEQLSNDTITNLWFRKQKKAYYSFDGLNSKNYVLDTGLDRDSTTMNAYRWEQVNWFANAIKNDNPIHATVFMHIVWYNAEHSIAALADNITKVIDAFNNRSTITLNNQTYNFALCTGHIEYVLSGHIHGDYNETVNNVLCIASNWFGGNQQSFDLVLNDYDGGKIKMVRVGAGSNREFNI